LLGRSSLGLMAHCACQAAHSRGGDRRALTARSLIHVQMPDSKTIRAPALAQRWTQGLGHAALCLLGVPSIKERVSGAGVRPLMHGAAPVQGLDRCPAIAPQLDVLGIAAEARLGIMGAAVAFLAETEQSDLQEVLPPGKVRPVVQAGCSCRWRWRCRYCCYRCLTQQRLTDCSTIATWA